MASVGGGVICPTRPERRMLRWRRNRRPRPPAPCSALPSVLAGGRARTLAPLPPRLETDGTALSLLQLCVKTRNRPCSFTFNASKILHKSCKGPNTDCNKYLPPPRPDPEPARGGKVCERHRGSAARTGAAISCVWRRRRRSCCCCSWSVPS